MSIENVFVLGNFYSGTNWIHYLIQQNLRQDLKSQTLLGVHRFTDDDNELQPQWKHVAPSDLMLRQQKLLVVYLIRPFEQWAGSMLQRPLVVPVRPHGSALKPNGWVETTDSSWNTEPSWLHEVYCRHVSQIYKMLCEQQKHYIIARTDKLQSTSGIDLLQYIHNNTDILETTDRTIQCWTSCDGPETRKKNWKTISSFNKPVYPVKYELTHDVQSILDRLNVGFVTSFD